MDEILRYDRLDDVLSASVHKNTNFILWRILIKISLSLRWTVNSL